MECREVQLWLLQAADPRRDRAGQPQLARHLRTCAACRGLAGKLVRLDEAWRDEPLPAGMDAARERFLQRLPRRAVRPSRRSAARWVAVAALVLVTVGLGVWLLPSGGERDDPDLVEQLVAWNLDIAEASGLAERGRIHGSQAEELQQAVRRKALPNEERQLAELLLRTSALLITDDDPLAEADALNDVAEQLLVRMNKAVKARDFAQADRLAGFYGKVSEQGVAAKLTKAPKAEARDARRAQRLQDAAERRTQKMNALLKDMPVHVEKKIRKALEDPGKPRKQPKAKAGAPAEKRP